jgi:hypothetical protein
VTGWRMRVDDTPSKMSVEFPRYHKRRTIE